MKAVRIMFWFALTLFVCSVAAIPVLHLLIYRNEDIPDAVATLGGTILALSLLLTIALGTIRGWIARDESARTIGQQLDLHEVESRGFHPGAEFGMSVLESLPKVAPMVLSGSFRGIDVIAFSYVGTTTDPKTNAESTLRGLLRFFWVTLDDVLYSCAVTGLPVNAPHLLAERTGWLVRLGRWMGRSPDMGVGDPAFDRAFDVTCEDPGFARDVLDNDVRRWISDRRVNIEIAGPWLLCFGYHEWPRALPELLGSLEGIVRRIPASTWWPYQAAHGGSDTPV